MVNVREALHFVQAQGDDLARARAMKLVEAIDPSPQVLAALEEKQTAAGAWPVGLEEGAAESIAQTCEVLTALLDLRLIEHPLGRRGVNYLLSQQEEDGSWYEHLELAPEPLWQGRGEEAARFYLTAWASSMLVVFGHQDSSQANAALDFLLNHQLEGGTFPGFPRYATGYALPLFTARLGKRSGPARNILRTLRQDLGDEEWTSAEMATVLRNLLIAEYGLEIPLVRATWEELRGRQQEDGSWSDGDAEAALQVTLDVLWCWRQITY